jgi:hypothetical protein
VSENPAIHKQPSGDVDIDVPERQSRAVESGELQTGPDLSTDPANLDHPEELMGE